MINEKIINIFYDKSSIFCTGSANIPGRAVYKESVTKRVAGSRVVALGTSTKGSSDGQADFA
jgi:hypothetical protein